MHPFLQNLSMLTLSELINDEDKCYQLFQWYDVIPDKETPVNCPSCHVPLTVWEETDRSKAFRYFCPSCQ